MIVDIARSFWGAKCLPKGSWSRAVLTGPWMVTSRDVTVLSTWIGSRAWPVKPNLIARVTCAYGSVHHSLGIIVKCTDFRFMNAQLTKLTLKHLKTFSVYVEDRSQKHLVWWWRCRFIFGFSPVIRDKCRADASIRPRPRFTNHPTVRRCVVRVQKSA